MDEVKFSPPKYKIGDIVVISELYEDRSFELRQARVTAVTTFDGAWSYLCEWVDDDGDIDYAWINQDFGVGGEHRIVCDLESMIIGALNPENFANYVRRLYEKKETMTKQKNIIERETDWLDVVIGVLVFLIGHCFNIALSFFIIYLIKC